MISEMPSRKYFDDKSPEAKNPLNVGIEEAEPKFLFRKLAMSIRPDRPENHEASLELLDAYEKAKNGEEEELIKIFKKHFPDLNSIEVSHGENVTEDEFQKEQIIREKIYNIIFYELRELCENAKRSKDASLVRNHNLQNRYKDLCVEYGIPFTSDFRDMKYDQKEIFRKLYDISKQISEEIKLVRKKQK